MEFANAFPQGSTLYGFDGNLWMCNESGDRRLPYPAIVPYDPDEEVTTWPKAQLHFVTMAGTQYAVIAETMREASVSIERANGWI